jgi:hypothetical protein
MIVRLKPSAKLPVSYDTLATLAARRFDALVWLATREASRHIVYHDGKAFGDAVRKADAECDEYGRLADGA